MEKEEAMEMSADRTDTIPRMFWNGVKTRGPKTVFRQKNLGIWQSVSWSELGQIAREIGMGLAALGYQPGEVVSILSNTNKEWVCADLGTLGAAGVVSGIYPTDAAAQVEYLLSDSGSVFAFVEDEEQLDKVLEVRKALPNLRKVVVFDEVAHADFSSADETISTLKDYMESGNYRRGNQNFNINVVGTTPNYLKVKFYTLTAGRAFTAGEDEAQRRIVILGSAVPEMFNTNPQAMIGQELRIAGTAFEVVGVLSEKGGSGSFQNPDEQVLIPLQTARYRVMGTDRLRTMSVEAVSVRESSKRVSTICCKRAASRAITA